jgi:hypothetical protein
MYRPAQTLQMNGSGQGTSPVHMALVSQRNRDTLENTLVQDIESKIGQRLNDRQQDKLSKALNHYIEEVYRVQGDKPVSLLNREILMNTRQYFVTYLQRQEGGSRQLPTTASQPIVNSSLFQDTSTRFTQLQNERQEVKAVPPAVPDFRISLSEDGPTSVDLYEQAKKQREAEALRIASGPMKDAMDRMDPGIQRRIQADDNFRSTNAAVSRATDLSAFERQQTSRTLDMPLVVPPDRRELMLPANVIIEPTGTPRDLGQGNSNPTITYPPFGSKQKTNLSQDIIIREERIVSYKEIENNLFMYSADRNWLFNTRENRYNFTVVFDPANNGNIQGPTQQVNKKFKNIVRIELVKAIFPVEGIYTFSRPTFRDKNDSSYQYNVLSLPYVSVVIDELDNNNYGTDNMIDKAFGVVQYDANWFPDITTDKDSRGFTAFIPKFLKCQKVYEPTPLSTLQKLSVSFVQPNGELISPTHDALDVSEIWGAGYSKCTGSAFNLTEGADPKYFFIYTKEFFSRFQFSVGDILRVGNYNYEPGIMQTSDRLRYFCEWLNTFTGHMIVGIGYNKSATQFVDGPNAAGYANCIIIGARYKNPSTGSTDLDPFGQNINNGFIANYGRFESPRRCINLSRQVQLVLRVITRELDPAGQLRPDDV